MEAAGCLELAHQVQLGPLSGLGFMRLPAEMERPNGRVTCTVVRRAEVNKCETTAVRRRGNADAKPSQTPLRWRGRALQTAQATRRIPMSNANYD